MISRHFSHASKGRGGEWQLPRAAPTPVYQLRLAPLLPEARAQLLSTLEAWAAARGCRLAAVSADDDVVYLDGKLTAVELEELSGMDGVAKLTAEDARPSSLPASTGATPPVRIFAGPCSVEDEDRLLALAASLKEAGATALRGGAFKPRTSPYAFQGLGREGLAVLARVSAATGLPVVTEVLDPRDLDLVAEHAAMLQVGSRNMSNAALLKEVGRAGKPVLLKRGMAATLDEFLYAAEYVALGGCPEIMLCERGLRHFDPAVRNLLDLAAVPALKQRTGLPVFVDPSHGTGRAALVAPMMKAALAAGADGLLVEVHATPDAAWSDASQALPLSAFRELMPQLARVLESLDRTLALPQDLPTSAPAGSPDHG
jgi:3-deoxy-7-phosphoheptulonate synthase